ncbi:MAG: cadherin-like domain-containing protein, partial [Planctomycetales bacterium]|nr:cadherin-like domain-containing protein [Planctomycetales bacterium]
MGFFAKREQEAATPHQRLNRLRRHRAMQRGAFMTGERLESRCVLNAAPITIPDTYTTPFATAIDRSAPGWIANDSDTDGDSLRLSTVSAPQFGNVTWSESGDWQYRPADGFVGVDHVQYQVTDGIASSDLTDVRIRVGTYSEMILADAPLAYWPLNDRQVAHDLSGHGNDGTYDGVTAGVPGAIAAEATTAADFPRENSYVYLSVRPQLNALRHDFTIEAWIKPKALVGHGRIFTNSQYDTSRGIAFGAFEKSLVFTTLGIKDYISKPVFNELNRWYHVAVVFDVNDDASLYVDGQLIDKITGNNPARTTTSASFLGLQWDFNQHFSGTIDEVAIYSRSLTSSDIGRHYQMGVVAAGKIPAATADVYQ